MKLYIRVFGLMLVLALALAGCKVSTGKDQNGQTLDTVQGLFVRDIPNDGGDGLVIGWKPLPREKRIQEYRIYRGLTPDSLFYLASVAVNVKTGVASDSMYYYDSGYNDFVDINSPGKLKHEKQKKGSILYRSIPPRYGIGSQVERRIQPLLDNGIHRLLSPDEESFFRRFGR